MQPMKELESLDSDHTQHTQKIRPNRRNHNTQTPLRFALKINGRYYICYDARNITSLIIKSVIFLVVNVILCYFINQIQSMGDNFKLFVTIALITQYICYLMISFLDPGTLLEDEDDSYSEERHLCNICQLYKISSSKHCLWCNKCIQKYDHHCSVFGKCIGKRNLFFFWLFLILSGLEGPLSIILFLTNLIGTVPQSP